MPTCAPCCRFYFEQKKAHSAKADKTLASNAKALKQAEHKTMHHVSQAAAVATIQQMRKAHWFEKFNWFISSEGYLVLSGRDAQQNEILVKRCAPWDLLRRRDAQPTECSNVESQ